MFEDYFPIYMQLLQEVCALWISDHNSIYLSFRFQFHQKSF